MPRSANDLIDLLPRDTAAILYARLRSDPSEVARVLQHVEAILTYLEERHVVLSPPDFEAVIHIVTVHLLHEVIKTEGEG